MEQTIQEIFENFLMAMNVEFRHTEVMPDSGGLIGEDDDDEREEEAYYCNVLAKDNSQLIGKHGRTLQAVQHLLKLIVYKRVGRMISVTVDIDGYRKRQQDSVMEIAQRYIDKVRETGKAESLPPMSPYFRRVVHLYLTQDDYTDLTTTSEGHGSYRHVVIKPQT